MNEESRVHFKLKAIFKYFFKKKIFIRILYLHTDSDGRLGIPTDIPKFKALASAIFLLIQPTERDIIKPETYFENIDRLKALLPTPLYFLNPFKPKFSDNISCQIEKTFCSLIIEREDKKFKNFVIERTTTCFYRSVSFLKPEHSLESFRCGDIIYNMLDVSLKIRREEIALKCRIQTRQRELQIDLERIAGLSDDQPDQPSFLQ